MKKIFTLLVCSLFSLSLLAYDGSRLSVSMVSNGTMDIKVEVDGRKYKLEDNSITLSNLPAGLHQVKIYREKKKNGNGFGNSRKQEILYASNVVLKKGFHLDIIVNRFGKALVDERRIGNREDEWFENGDDGYDDSDWHENYFEVMSVEEFKSVKESISREWMESNKLQSVRFIVEKNKFTTLQVKELMSLFGFESNRLEVAKLAYRKTVDKHNYFMVNDCFTFNSSKDELARFIRESR